MYVTKDDYLKYSGIDLEIELSGMTTDKTANRSEIFIRRIEDWIIQYLQFNYCFNGITNVEEYKKAIMYQIDYIRYIGDIDLISAESQKLSPNAYRVLKRIGMCNIISY